MLTFVSAFGDVCTKDSDCAAADFTTCQMPSGCVKGTCSTCITGYVVSSGACSKLSDHHGIGHSDHPHHYLFAEVKALQWKFNMKGNY